MVVLYGSCVGVIYQHLACNSFPFKLSFQYIKNLVVLKGAVRQDNDNYWFKRKEKNILLKVFLNNEYLWRNLKERRCKLLCEVLHFFSFLCVSGTFRIAKMNKRDELGAFVLQKC